MTTLTELIKLAAAATPGPWQSHGSHIYPNDPNVVIAQVHNPGSRESDFPLVANVAFIAAANPATVKRMAELLVMCREALEKIQKETFSDPPQISVMDSASFDVLAALDEFEGGSLFWLKSSEYPEEAKQ